MTLIPSGSGGARLARRPDPAARPIRRGRLFALWRIRPARRLFGSGYRAFMARQAPAQMAASGVAASRDAAAPNAGASPAAAPVDFGGDFDWAPVVRAASAGRGASDPAAAVQLAYNDATCPTCHFAPPPPSPPPTLPPLHLPETIQQFLAAPMGVDLRPAPLAGLATAAQIAGALAGPQVSNLTPPRDPPRMPQSGNPYEWSSRPECSMQYESDLGICRRLKAPGCYSMANERLGNCNKGRLDFPPLLGW
jgi:hypothetical protein